MYIYLLLSTHTFIFATKDIHTAALICTQERRPFSELFVFDLDEVKVSYKILAY